MLKELLKLSNHLSRKGLIKEADYLNHALENYVDEMEEGMMEEGMMEEGVTKEDMMEEDMLPEDDFESSPDASFAEGELDSEEAEEDMDMSEEDMDMSGEELSFEGIETKNLHCCPQTKEFLSYVMGIVDSDEEKALFIDMLEGCDELLKCKEDLSMEDPSKEKLLEFIEISNNVMYNCGMLSSMLNEDLQEKCGIISQHIEECLSQALEDDMSEMEEVAMEEPDLEDEAMDYDF